MNDTTIFRWMSRDVVYAAEDKACRVEFRADGIKNVLIVNRGLNI